MLADKIAENMYYSFTENEEGHLKGNVEYKDLEQLVKWTYEEIKDLLPEDKRKIVNDLSAYVTDRENTFAKEVYKKGFKDGAKLILELGK